MGNKKTNFVLEYYFEQMRKQTYRLLAFGQMMGRAARGQQIWNNQPIRHDIN